MSKTTRKVINRYRNGKIYKIVSKQTDRIYIGSTMTGLMRRFCIHKSCLKHSKGKGTKKYTSYEILEYDDAKIILIEKYPCENSKELREREQYYMDKYFDRCVNKQRASPNPNKMYICPYCGCCIRRKGRKRHNRSKAHKEAVKFVNNLGY